MKRRRKKRPKRVRGSFHRREWEHMLACVRQEPWGPHETLSEVAARLASYLEHHSKGEDYMGNPYEWETRISMPTALTVLSAVGQLQSCDRADAIIARKRDRQRK